MKTQREGVERRRSQQRQQQQQQQPVPTEQERSRAAEPLLQTFEKLVLQIGFEKKLILVIIMVVSL